MDVLILGECIIEHPGSFQPDSWTKRFSCVPLVGAPKNPPSGGAGPVCRACAGLGVVDSLLSVPAGSRPPAGKAGIRDSLVLALYQLRD